MNSSELNTVAHLPSLQDILKKKFGVITISLICWKHWTTRDKTHSDTHDMLYCKLMPYSACFCCSTIVAYGNITEILTNDCVQP